MSLQALRELTRRSHLPRRLGTVREVSGLSIEADGPDVRIGEVCRIDGPGGAAYAEAVALRRNGVTLMPYAGVHGLAAGCTVEAMGELPHVPVGDALLGRVIDGFGVPLDGMAKPRCETRQPIRGDSVNPLQRPPITQVLDTGVRAIDALLTIGRGQRIGIFAGSGVGKSTLLGMMARHAKADVNVIALVGERGREVKEFIERQLGAEGVKRSVVVVAAADQPALARLQAAYAAVTIAEYFREQGRQVILTMDSITRFAMARREVGLAAGEPPTARGYTPSVFAELPQLCERCGTSASGGSITALLTVLVEGDDHNEPIADHLRAILDGHVVLSRALAQRGHFPAIDVLKSVSRVMSDIVGAQEAALARKAQALLDVLERNRPLVEIGAYVAGSNAALDQALALQGGLEAFLCQRDGGVARPTGLAELARITGMAK